MCVARQWRALFQHVNFQKCSAHGVFGCVWFVLTSTCASRHNGVQFFISQLTRWLRTRRFSEPTCQPSGATKHWKNMEKHSVSRLPFALLDHLFFSAFLFSDFLSSSFTSTFPSVHIVGSLTPKLE